MDGRAESRQRPGYACEECRKKKLRCDRVRPQCGPCANARIACRVTDRRMPRGSKTGSTEALRSRIYELERHLSDIQSGNVTTTGHARDLEELVQVLNRETPEDAGHSNSTAIRDSESEHESSVFSHLLSEPSTAQRLSQHQDAGFEDILISDLMKADLTQLYFDRVHPVAPILNQAKVLEWARNPNAMNEYRKCLQHAMWLSAMAFSSQFGNIRDVVYARTRAVLEELDLKGSDIRTCPIEHVQSWILLTIYEFTKTTYRRAWLSAGRVFRFVQLARLYNLDSSRPLGAKDAEGDPVEKEEKRRTFWVAYCLDRFISLSNGVPMTLSEDVVCTRLPGLEMDFHNIRVSQQPFLSEVMASRELRAHSPLTECIILVTICTRALAHKQVSHMEALYGNAPLDFATRYDWLNLVLTSRLDNLQVNYPLASSAANSMIMFAHMVAQTAIIYLCHIMEPLSNNDESSSWTGPLQDRAVLAAQEISRLAEELEHLGHFKAHTFTSLPIYLSAAKLRSHLECRKRQFDSSTYSAQAVEKSLQTSLNALRKLRSVNNLATYYLNMVESYESADTCFLMG